MKCIPENHIDGVTSGKSVKAWGLILVFFQCCLFIGCGAGGIGSDNQNPDPVIEDLPVAYIKRSLVTGEGELSTDDIRTPVEFRPGAELFFRDQASPSASEISITAGVFSEEEFANEDGEVLYDIQDLHASFDGTKLLFSMRAPDQENQDVEPTWNIWEYDVTTRTVKRVIESDNGAEAGHDIAPHYLTDGRIVFASTRQRQSKAILLDEGKSQYDALNEKGDEPSFNLHVMSADGGDISQITFNQSNDLDPILLQNGKVLFSRWDGAGPHNKISLYQVNPDGTQLELVYGYHSHDTGTDDSSVQFVKPRAMEDGRILVNLRPFESRFFGGDIVALDIANYTDHDQPLFGQQGEQGQTSLTLGDVQTGDEFNLAGRFASADPMWDNTGRILVSWSQCRVVPAGEEGEEPDTDNILPCTEERLVSEDFEPAPPLYSLWIYDPAEGTQLPMLLPEEGAMYGEGVLLQPKPRPTFIPDLVNSPDADSDLIEDNLAVVHIRSVYDLDGVDSTETGIATLADPVQTPADNRPARFIRIIKPVSRPDDDVVDIPRFAYGPDLGQRMKDILGYVPVEPDGSVMFRVPANVAFAVEVLDGDGRRISPRHQNWLHMKAGDSLQCVGCHTAESEVAHGRFEAQAPSINQGALTSGLPFPNTEPALFADIGETMAQTYSRINGVRALSPDIEYVDDWSDPNIIPKTPSFTYTYQDLETEAPINAACADTWGALCRIVINYETHIHPLWSTPRQVVAVDPDTSEEVVLQDNTCTFCHSPIDPQNATARVPLAQLDLSDGNNGDSQQFKSYEELLEQDNEQELVNGVLQDLLIPVLDGNGNQVFEVDDDGNLVLDADGNPIPRFTNVRVSPVMRASGANNSDGFFSRFESTGTHAGWLNDAELKLLSEWLDIGGQYYNNPFDIPQD